MLKKILIGLGVVFGLLVIGLVALALLFDANKYKPQIERYVHDNYKRTLKFDGDLSLAVFPRIALALPATTLSNLSSDRTSASLKSAKVSVALLPLLRGRIEVGTIGIDGLTAAIERRHDGSTNIDDLLKRDTTTTPAKPGKPGGTPDFEVGGIELTNADLTLNDLETKRTVHLARLTLKTGALAPVVNTPLEFDTQFEVSEPQANGKVRVAGTLELDLIKKIFAASSLDAALNATVEKQPVDINVTAERAAYLSGSGGIEALKVDAKAKGKWATMTLDESRLLAPALTFDPAGKRLSVGGLEASAKGKSNADAFEVSLTAPKIDVTESSASGQRVVLSAKFAPAAKDLPTGQARLTLEGVSGSANQLEIAKLAIDGDGEQGARKFAAALSGPLTASFTGKTLSLPHFAGEITVDDPALPQKTLKAPVTLKVAIDGAAEKVDAGFTSKLDESNAAAEFSVRGFASPKITFEASADRLNVDHYFPPPPPAQGNDSADAREDPKVDLSALRGLDLTGTVKVGSLQARGLKASSVDVGVKAAGGRLDVAPLSAQLYSGSLAGNAALIADGNEVRVDTSLNEISIAPLLKDLANRDLIEGRGNVKLAINTSGATVGELKKKLAGSASLKLRDGAIKGINLAAKLRDAKNLLSAAKSDTTRANAAEKTDFSELSATFMIKDGVAINEDLDMKSPLLRVGGAGKVDLGASGLDYTTRVSVVGTLKGQDGRSVDQLKGVTVPVKLEGPFDKLAWSIDWSSAAQDALKSQLAQKVAPQVQAQKDKARAAAEQKARDALKGLLPK